MTRRMMLVACVLFLLPVLGCQEDTPLSPVVEQPDPAQGYVDPEQIALAVMASTGWPAVDEAGNPVELDSGQVVSPDKCHVIFTGRKVVHGDVVHYGFLLRVGPGEYDVIGLHRVVRERRPGVPIHTARSVFMLHGGGKDFVGNFMPGFLSPNVSDEFGVAVYLAQRNVDVWGVDMSSTMVPWQGLEVPFMAGWGMARHVQDLRTGIQVARVLRRSTGSGYRPLILSAYSSGVFAGYAFLNAETQSPPGLRNICGYIPVEFGVEPSNEVNEANQCNGIASNEELMAQGIYGAANILPLVGVPARDDPDGPSDFLPGFTNLAAALNLATWPLNAPLTGHFTAGVIDENGMATGFQYQSVSALLDFLSLAPVYDQPVAFSRDGSLLTCPSADTPWDDHFSQIRVPILWIVAAGGYGVDWDDFPVMGSHDEARLVVSLHAPEEVLLDYGHLDPYNADNAADLVWQPMLEWIVSHTPGGPN